ncbi:MAG: CinA family protein [Promethearchaeota archaeon]
MDDLKRIEQIINSFTEKKIQIAIAESCTGGYISHMITNISGASKVFERGIISYSNDAKIDVLKVDPKAIEKFGAVSEIVAKQMANNIRKFSKADIGIGITGIAGPTGGSEEKPVGLVFIGFSTKDKTIVKKNIFKTDRITFKTEVLIKIIEFLEDLVF